MEVEVKKLKGKNLSLQEELEKATHKLDIYKKAGLETVTKEAMMASQHKKEEGITALSSKEYDVLRESHSELQLLYRERTHELETMTNTITAHSSTYETLQNQVERVTHEAEERERELRISIRELQEMLVRREERCERLEAQVLAHCEGDQGLDPTLDHLTQDKDRQLTQTLDLGRHDNLLEFHIAGMTFEAVDLGRLKTFVSWTVPFALKDPLQHTNVAVGSPARYSHSSLYSFHMSHRNLESLRQDTISVSVYRLLDSGHPTKVGECRLSFSEVLDHPRNTLHGTAPVMLALDHPNDAQHFAPAAHMLPGQVIGTMSYWFRLERPCEDVIAQYLHSVNLLAHHQKKQEQISQTPKIVKSTTPMKRDASRDKDRLIQMPTSVINEDKEKDREDSRRDTEINKEVGSKKEKMEAVAVERESKKSVMVGVVPVPAPRSQAPPLSHSPDGNNTTTLNIQRHTRGNQVTQHECENDKVDHESRNTDSQKLADEAERDEKVVIGETSLQQRRSRSNSVTSTGTYNIGSPQQRQRSSDSGDDSESSANLKLEKKIRRGSSSPAVHSNLSREGKVSPVVSTRATRPKSAIPPKQENSSSVQSSGSSSSRSKMGIQQMHGKSPSVHQIVESSNDIDEKEDTGTLEDESSEEEDIVVVKDRDSYHTSQQHMEDQTVIRVTSGGKGSRKESRSISSQDSNNTRKKGGGRSEHIRRKEGIYSSTGIRHRTEKQHHHQSSTESESSTSRSSKRLEAEDHHITTDESYQDSDSEGVVAIPSTSHKEEKLNVYVEVCSLMLAPTTTAALAQDPLVDLLFIDYHGFLGLPPDRLETPLSLPKPTKPHTPLNFNFGQELCVDPDQYPERWSALGDLMKGRGLLKFTVTSEPPPHLQDSQDCNDIGYVYVDMHGLAESEEDLDEVQLPVESAEDGRHLGSLTVTLHITHVLKHLYNA
ncbi:hypothetical protein Pmani_026021 [Petrolisthes manimaculis]|uniref:RPGR-interacting protein 1 first C2 domain-containing protein n=1 Tax=Petrolisthes manimaculis TaxID=1843537 RepID=A0AAE1P4E9_9EUCA|nr:hypothetical protein Pmani_026021 [Petrolisthes manimaculis]